MPLAADDRDRVWLFAEDKPYLLNDDSWVDFYILLEVPRTASAREVEDAIVARGADILALSFARGVPDRMRLLAHYLPDLRLIMLNPAVRASYDDQLLRHEKGFVGAIAYEEWRKTSLGKLARLKARSGNWARRSFKNLWENEYI